MTRFKRRILLGTTLVVLVFLGLGVWFYFTFFGSTNTALQRAETFLFRRMKVADLVEPGSELVTLVDVTPVNRTRNFHNFSLETPEFFDDLYLRLTNADTPRSRLIYQVQAPNGAVYWVLTRGR